MIRDLFFDLDNTILDFDLCEKQAIAMTLAHLGIDPCEDNLALYSKINLAQWKLHEKGVLTLEELRVRRFALLFEKLGKKADPQFATEFYGKCLANTSFTVKGAAEVLDKLYGKYRLYIASNGISSVQHSRIRLSGIEKYFEKIFISEEIRFSKPDIRFFEGCFSQIPDFSNTYAAIIGDSLTSDIAGGKAAGITTIFIGDGESTSTDYSVNDISLIPELLKNIK